MMHARIQTGLLSMIAAASLCVTPAKGDTTFAKLADGEFAYYTNSDCTVESQLETPPETGIAGCIVLFGSDEEYQALVPYTNEIKTAFSVLLQGNMNYSQTNNQGERWWGPWTKAVAGGTQIQAMVRRNNGYSMIGFAIYLR